MAEVDFQALFDAAPAALALLSPDLVFVAVNRAYERLLDRTREEIIGRNIFEVFPGGSSGEGVAVLRSSLERALAGGEGEADTLMLQRYDIEVPGSPGASEERYWSVASSPLLDREGTVCGVIVRIQEVTSFIDRMREDGLSAFSDAGLIHAAAVEAQLFSQTRELQSINRRLRSSEAEERQVSEGLREMVRHQRQAVADTSHDLRGPVTGLQIRLEDALADPDADPREILLAALHDAERLGDIIGDLLELARLEAGALAPTEQVDLAYLVRDELARRDLKTAITTHLDPGIVVEGSPIRLARLVGNLLANAERHARSRIEVSVAADDGQAVLEVIDDGPGIPDADREEVFTRFFRRSDARTSDPSGSGLGLPIARQIAESHGGTLHSAHRADGASGARLILRLPLRRP
ncbi:PAS domain-containing sensor histidine kinase [Actinocorallia populi]|uniref:PAS domain-containing sensor histidine kinase n=1 Tax=Actinocorallia populi TaxID=2079200 RepID=UPI0018E57C18|nr:PAS domain-containing sensor histidine kinase [Actinocorallia populi]